MPVKIPVARLRKFCDPFRFPVWGDFRVTENMVRSSIRDNDLQRRPLDWDSRPHLHAARIAYFVVHGWNSAVNIDVGVPSMGCHVNWFLQDGNHRFAAAILRGDAEIDASVGGDIDFAFKLFGVDVTES